MKTKARPLLHVETWLREGELMRRAGSRQSIPLDEFEAQRKPGTKYIIIERVPGTYSDGKGASRPAYERVE